MESVYARAETRIWGTEHGWSLSGSVRGDKDGRLCKIDLEIQSDGQGGFHLVMSPEGCFTADTWCPTREEVLANALELFGVQPDDWSNTPQ